METLWEPFDSNCFQIICLTPSLTLHKNNIISSYRLFISPILASDKNENIWTGLCLLENGIKVFQIKVHRNYFGFPKRSILPCIRNLWQKLQTLSYEDKSITTSTSTSHQEIKRIRCFFAELSVLLIQYNNQVSGVFLANQQFCQIPSLAPK